MQRRAAVAVYARISQDRDGEGLGVRRQVADCRAEADRLGWTVAEEYVVTTSPPSAAGPAPRTNGCWRTCAQDDGTP